MSNINKDIGRLIVSSRRLKNIYATELAKKVGLTKQAINRYEKGQVNISAERIYSIADALDCSVYDLLPPNKLIAD